MPAETVPAWKFWHPLPFWQVIAIGFVAQLVCTLPVVFLREGLGLGIPAWVGSGLGGGLMFVAVRAMAQRKLSAGG